MFFLMQAVKYGETAQLGQAEKKAKEIERAKYDGLMNGNTKKVNAGEITEDDYWRRVPAERNKSIAVGDSFRKFAQDLLKMKGAGTAKEKEDMIIKLADAAIRNSKNPAEAVSERVPLAVREAWNRRMAAHGLALPLKDAPEKPEAEQPPVVADAGKKKTPSTVPGDDLADAAKKRPSTVPPEEEEAKKKKIPTTVPEDGLADIGKKKPTTVPEDGLADIGKKKPTTVPEDDLADAGKKKPTTVPEDDGLVDGGKKKPSTVPPEEEEAKKKKIPTTIPEDDLADAGKKKPTTVPEDDGLVDGAIPMEAKPGENAFSSTRSRAMDLGTIFPQVQNVDWKSNKAQKLVAGSLLSLPSLKQAFYANGMESEFVEIEKIRGPDAQTTGRLRLEAAANALLDISYSELLKRGTGRLFSMAQESANFAFSNMGFSVATKVTDAAQAGIYYGYNLGHGLGVAAWVEKSPLNLIGAWGKRIQLDSEVPYLGFAFGYQDKPEEGFNISAMGLAVGNVNRKNFALSKIGFDGNSPKVMMQMYLPGGVTPTDKAFMGTVGVDLNLGWVWKPGAGRIGVGLGGAGYLSSTMKNTGAGRSIDPKVYAGPKAHAFYQNEYAGVQLSFKMLDQVEGAAGAYYMLSMGSKQSVGPFAKYLVESIGDKTGVWGHSLDLGARYQIGDRVGIDLGTRQNLNIMTPDNYSKPPNEYYLKINARLF